MENYQIEMESKLLDLLHKNNISQFYKIYVWQQYIGNDDLFVFDKDHVMYDIINDKLTEFISQRQGFIYLASNDSLDGYYKVGMTRKKNPYSRIESLNQAGLIEHLKLVKAYATLEVSLEHRIHAQLKLCTPFHRKEFFKTALFIIDDVVTNEINAFTKFITQDLGLNLMR